MRRNARWVFVAILTVAGLYAWLGGFRSQLFPAGGGSPNPPTRAVAGSVASAPGPAGDAAAQLPPALPPAPPAAPSSERITIGRNESFYVAFQRAGFDHDTIMQLVRACREHVDLGRVRRGDVFELTREPAAGLLALRAEVDAAHYLVAERNPAGFSAELRSYPVQRVVKGARGTVRSSLFEALTETGADAALAVSLSDILGWDIDFFRDLRRGDSFEVVYEEFAYGGRAVREPRLLSAKFINDGRVLEAYYFPSQDGRAAYFDGAGRSLEKQFLRAPLRYDRVSSGYTRRRFHPVLKYYRPHEGIDYAAPTGTPVRATASGVVNVRERYRGNGNYIVLRHGAGYESWYLHLSGFAKGLALGDRVQQGEIIGFVGSTGLSTAPHLCYRIKHNGRFLNPSRMDMPPSEPVAAHRRAEFEQLRDTQRGLQAAIPDSSSVVVLEASPAADAPVVSVATPPATVHTAGATPGVGATSRPTPDGPGR